MTVDEINELVKRKHELTAEELDALVQAMLDNPEAKEILVRGAFRQGNYGLVAELLLSDNTKTTDGNN